MICLNSTQFVSMKEASEFAGTSKSSIWRYAHQSHLIETRTNAKRQSVYKLQDVAECFGVPYCEQSQQDDKRIALYGRVSTQEQRRDGNLDRQIQRLREFVANQWNAEPLEYSDVQSAFSDRAGFNQLCADMMDGKISIVVCEFADRAQRQSSGKALFEMIARKFNVEIVYVEHSIPESAMSELMEEFVSYATCVMNKISAQKQANRKRVDIDDSILERANQMINSGHSIKSCAAVLQSEGITGTKGQPISNQILGARLKVWQREQMRKQVLTTGTIETSRDEIDNWLDSATTKGSDHKESAKLLLDSWNSYAVENGFALANIASFAQKLKAKGFRNARGSNGRVFWHGLRLA